MLPREPQSWDGGWFHPRPRERPCVPPRNGSDPTGTDYLSAEDITHIRGSLLVVEPQVADMAVYFYAILFTRYPEVRQLFPQEMDVQRERLLRALLRIVDVVDDPGALGVFCCRLGQDHRKFGAVPEHYPAVGECLLSALSRFAGTAWTQPVASAWERAYSVVAHRMIMAAEEDARHRPAVWEARITGHVRHGHGIAEVTVAPTAPYVHQAGQFVSVETPWWPRLWRSYSPANAPRPDSSLTFHVRAVPNGRVSNALVHRARIGETVRIGAPQGQMTLPADVHQDLLLIAGGTGLAPIRALVEQAVHHGGEQRVQLFIGARTAEELYGMNDMLRMAQRHHWLTVRAAVSEQHLPGAHGSLARVLHEYGSWSGHVAFVSGPSPMVTSVVDVLTRRGVPRSRIHHDPLEAQLSTPA